MDNRILVLVITLLIAGAVATITLGALSSRASAAPAAPAGEHRVCPSGCAYSSIQAAVDAAQPGDVIKVAQGTYTDLHHIPSLDTATFTATQIVAITKSITIQGGYSSTDWDLPDPEALPTILDAGGQGRVMVIVGNGITPIVEGLRLTDGDATGLGPFEWGDVGGGVYIKDATPVISGNQVYSHTADRGGGLYLWYSSAILNSNTVSNNTAGDGGGGMELLYSPATLNGNTVSGNKAPTYSGGTWGGGVLLNSSDATLSGNTVTGNAASYGGGVAVYWSAAALNDNTVTSNSVSSYGGGLALYGSASTLAGNLVTGNTTSRQGGGLYFWYNDSILNNTVVADNTVNQDTGLGPGIYMGRSSLRLLHTTIARNRGGDGSGVCVFGNYDVTVGMTNTILVSHTVGITVTAGNTATLNATLWHANGTDRDGAGTVEHTADYADDPAFAADGYHLTASSAAIDEGVSTDVATDIDGDARPTGDHPDLGADEFVLRHIYLPLIIRH